MRFLDEIRINSKNAGFAQAYLTVMDFCRFQVLLRKHVKRILAMSNFVIPRFFVAIKTISACKSLDKFAVETADLSEEIAHAPFLSSLL